MEVLGKLTLSVVLGVIAIASRAYAVVLLWRWFMVPTFHLPPLGWLPAYGLCLLSALLLMQEPPEHKDTSYAANVGRLVGNGILAPWLMVGIAWIIK